MANDQLSNNCLDEEELLSEEELAEKQRIVSALLYKSEINMAILNKQWFMIVCR